jgi:hypothetical protein
MADNDPGGFGDGGSPDPVLPDPHLGVVDIIIGYIIDAIYSLAQAINYLYSIIHALLNFLVNFFRTLGKFLLHIWQQYVKRAIQWLASHVQKLRAWLKRTIGPIIKRLEKIKKWYDTHILKQQLRMLQMLQTIRRFLGILRLFHVKWAAKLDGTLADLQNRIEQSISIVRGTLNQIINTLAIAFDPTMVLTRNLLGASLLSNLGAVKRIFGFGDNRILSASEQATIDHDHALYYKTTVDAHVNALTATGPTAEDKSRRIEFRQALADVTNTTLPTQAPK